MRKKYLLTSFFYLFNPNQKANNRFWLIELTCKKDCFEAVLCVIAGMSFFFCLSQIGFKNPTSGTGFESADCFLFDLANTLTREVELNANLL